MKRIRTRAGVVALWAATWLVVWPVLALGSIPLVVQMLALLFDEDVVQHPLLMAEPAFYLPVLTLWSGAAYVCWIVAHKLAVPMKEATEGSRPAGMVVLVSIAIVVCVWWWILTKAS